MHRTRPPIGSLNFAIASTDLQPPDTQPAHWGRPRPSRYCLGRKGGRADECNGLENRRGESLRGFESPSFRHSKSQGFALYVSTLHMERCQSPADRASLLRRWRVTPPVGSNPTLSARNDGSRFGGAHRLFAPACEGGFRALGIRTAARWRSPNDDPSSRPVHPNVRQLLHTKHRAQ